MSGFPKILWPITVPTGGWDFGFTYAGAHVATVSAMEYTSILHLAAALEFQLDVLLAPHGATSTVTVSSLGTVTIAFDDGWAVDWATTDDAFSACLGYAETEAVNASNQLIATSQHLHGYYPGLISYGYNAGRGAGISRPFIWIPTWPMVRTHAGSRETRTVGPVYPSEELDLSLSMIKWTEYEDNLRGVRAWCDECVSSQFRVYRDRYTGTVLVPGTKGTDYHLVTFNGDLKTRDAQHPDYVLISAPLHKEP